MKKHLFFTLLAFTIVAMLPTIVSAEGVTSSIQEKVYVLTDQEKKRWGISDDASNPVETTAGWNQALKWAGEQGYTTFRVEDGHYLIAKGEKIHDQKARINMVGNMKLSLDKDVVLEKETNQWEAYSLLHVGSVENVIIEGGQFVGDRETHDYSVPGKGLSGTHEWGNGINLSGSKNVIINDVKMKNFSGDSMEIAGSISSGYYIRHTDVTAGGINSDGTFNNDTGKVRSDNKELTDLNKSNKELNFWLPNGVGKKGFDIYYYDQNDRFISAEKDLSFFKSALNVPENAAYYHAVFDGEVNDSIKINPVYINRSQNVQVLNSDLGYSRRQGISVVGGKDILIKNNRIHHVKGTAPQSGIDLEGGFYTNKDIKIHSNHFHDNNKYDVILFDGSHAEVKGNLFESNAIGVAVSSPFDYASIIDNKFKNAGLLVVGNQSEFKKNDMEDSSVRLSGSKLLFEGNQLTNTSLHMSGKKDYDITIKDLNAHNSDVYIDDEAVKFANVHISGEEGTLHGPGSAKSTFTNLKVSGFNSLSLPAGVYDGCSFISENASVQINKNNRYKINNCKIESKSDLLSVNNQPEVEIKNSIFTLTEDIGYGAALFIRGAKKFELSQSDIYAKNNTVTHTPVMKFGPYGSPKPSNIHNVSIMDVNIYGNPKYKNVIGLDTTNSGTDAPPYKLTNVNIHYGKAILKPSDQIK
ncbi:right-handed parallel beta-helix repeat-containing protein [Jeotgalibacillus malaysiensis]|uniref:right-handed parallel beta-helix repeat-containing protein n=1 Tax=Jeotgalibacillus malaysiensis TaxID=1508404 RepID=UPI00384C6493